jgi:hypothetical protein
MLQYVAMHGGLMLRNSPMHPYKVGMTQLHAAWRSTRAAVGPSLGRGEWPTRLGWAIQVTDT